jgi:hypothetical protein
MQPSASKGKAVEPAKKVKTLKPKSPAVIKKKIEQLFQEEKVIPPALAQKAQPVRTKKADLAPAPVKQAQMPEIKVHPTPAKQTQPVQKEKATSPAPVKKIVPVRAKKATPAPIPVKQVQVAEIKKVRPVLAKQAQPAQKEKTTSPAPVKKIVLVRAKKVTPAPIKQVKAAEIKKVRPAPAKQTQPVQKEKVTSPAPVKKIRPVRTKRITPVLAPVKQVKAAEIKVRPAPVKQAQPVQKEKAAPPAPVKKIRSVRVKKTTPVLAPVKQVKAAEIKVHPTPVKQAQPVQAKKKQALPVSRSIEKTTPIQPSAVAPTSRAKEVPPIATPRVTKPVEPTIAQRIKKAQPQKADVIDTPVNVTKEQKERAGKFTRMMEKSDAYVHYKKHGDNSKINEFDFRSLLLCTMESSPETLAKNIKLFREYAGIHNRQDLVTFLVFCEDKFSYLLKPQNKSSRKVKK